MGPTRRQVVRAAGATSLGVAVAGCLDGGQRRGVADVYVRNDAASAVTVAIRVTYVDDGETALDETVTLAPDEREKFNNEVVMETTARVVVEAADGSGGTYRWEVQGSLHAVVTATGVRFEPESRVCAVGASADR